MKKKIIALLLVAVMLLGAMPVSATKANFDKSKMDIIQEVLEDSSIPVLEGEPIDSSVIQDNMESKATKASTFGEASDFVNEKASFLYPPVINSNWTMAMSGGDATYNPDKIHTSDRPSNIFFSLPQSELAAHLIVVRDDVTDPSDTSSHMGYYPFYFNENQMPSVFQLKMYPYYYKYGDVIDNTPIPYEQGGYKLIYAPMTSTGRQYFFLADFYVDNEPPKVSDINVTYHPYSNQDVYRIKGKIHDEGTAYMKRNGFEKSPGYDDVGQSLNAIHGKAKGQSWSAGFNEDEYWVVPDGIATFNIDDDGSFDGSVIFEATRYPVDSRKPVDMEFYVFDHFTQIGYADVSMAPKNRTRYFEPTAAWDPVGVPTDDGRYIVYMGLNKTKFELTLTPTDMPIERAPFDDIDMWAKESIEWVYENELFEGTSKDKFSPNEKMNRAMLATVLWRLDGKPQVSGNSDFTDVKADKYYSGPIKWASDNKIVTGTNDKEFSPDGNVTREQLATMLYRYEKTEGDVTGEESISDFIDSNKVSSYAKEAMEWAYGNGILTGKTPNTLDPLGNATRAEVATMMKRFAD